MRKILFILILVCLIAFGLYTSKSKIVDQNETVRYFDFQAVDTMKTSRDLSREKLNDSSYDKVIDAEISAIKKTGATHVAIATPYDKEFIPFLRKYVASARKNNLKVWFRGNLSGWEGWFDYPRLTTAEHIKGIELFLQNNKDLFEAGDYFSSCPECENREKPAFWVYNDVKSYQEFLIEEYQMVKQFFVKNKLDVKSNLFSMNYDIAKAVMDPETTAKLDGLVVIDHYTLDVDQLANDIVEIAKKSGGKVLLGEFGAPIPDIHGEMNAKEQSEWLDKTMSRLIYVKELEGLSYWTATGGTTAIFSSDDFTPRESVAVLKKYFSPKTMNLKVKNQVGSSVDGFRVSYFGRPYATDGKSLALPAPHNDTQILIEKDGYFPLSIDAKVGEIEKTAVITAKNPPLWDRYLEIFRKILGL